MQINNQHATFQHEKLEIPNKIGSDIAYILLLLRNNLRALTANLPKRYIGFDYIKSV